MGKYEPSMQLMAEVMKHMSGSSVPKLAYSMKEAGEALGVGHQKIYDIVNDGTLRTYKVGRRRFCSHDAIVEFIRAREAETVYPIKPGEDEDE